MCLCVVIMFFLIGCQRNPVIEKLAKGEALTQQEQVDYQKQKEEFDKLVTQRKLEIEETTYKEATEAEKIAGKRTYKRRDSTMTEFDISSKMLEPFGFLAGDRVEGPNGKANVVGVYDGHIWFHTEGVKGAGFSDCKNKKECEEKGFKLINTRAPSQQQTEKQKEETERENIAEYSDIYFPPVSKIPYLKKE